MRKMRRMAKTMTDCLTGRTCKRAETTLRLQVEDNTYEMGVFNYLYIVNDVLKIKFFKI